MPVSIGIVKMLKIVLIYGSIIFCISFFVLLFLSTFLEKKTGRVKRTDFFFLCLFFALLVYISYHLLPNVSDDLYRHHGIVNWYRYGMPDYRDRIKNILPIDEGLNLLFMFKLSCYITSKLPNNGYLQVMYLSCNFGIVLLWIYIFSKRYHLYRYVLAHFILIYFALTPFFYCYSGLRNGTICHILGVAYYLYYVEKKKMIILISLYAIALMIHPITGIFLILQIWYEITRRHTYVFFLIFFWRVLLNVSLKIFELIPIDIIKYMGNKMDYYFNHYVVYADYRRVLAENIFMIMILIVIFLKNQKGQVKERSIRLYQIAVLFGLGAFHAIISDRISMMFGVASLPLLYGVLKGNKNRIWIELVLWTYEILLNIFYTISIFTYLRLDFV